MPTDEPAQDPSVPLDPSQVQQQIVQDGLQLNQQGLQQQQPPESARKPKAPSVRRACVACHTGKTRCSEVLPCQSCLKRGLGATCAYPDPDAPSDASGSQSASVAPQVNPQAVQFAPPPPPMYATLQGANIANQHYYDYNGGFAGASTSTFRPNKRPRTLTEEEAAAITRNFSRGHFFVGSAAPVMIDPRLPVRLTLGEGDSVHFTIGPDALT